MGDMSCAIWMATAGAPPIIMPVTDAQAGPYELLRGRLFGEVDPATPDTG